MRRILSLLAVLFFIASCGGSDIEEHRLPVADCSFSTKESYSEAELTGVWVCSIYSYQDTAISLKPDNTGTILLEDEGIAPITWSVSGCVLELRGENISSGDLVIGEVQILDLTDTYLEFLDSEAETYVCRK